MESETTQIGEVFRTLQIAAADAAARKADAARSVSPSRCLQSYSPSSADSEPDRISANTSKTPSIAATFLLISNSCCAGIEPAQAFRANGFLTCDFHRLATRVR